MSIREILFRGKRVDNGEWVEGFYVQVDNKAYISLPLDISGDGVITMFDEKQSKAHLYTLSPFLEVVPKTVGQYTGLTDKNDNKIFEGDIVDRRYHNFETFKDIEEVKMSEVDDSDGWNANHTLGWCAGESSLLDVCCDCRVIGNIHDNPELIGNSEQLEVKE